MKHILSILLIFALLFSFAACRNIADLEKPTETTTTTIAPPVIEEIKKTKEFKDENGRVVYVVDVILPEISENCDENVREYINTVINQAFESACEGAEKNINAAASFMDKSDSKEPWTEKITFETTYLTNRFVCFLTEYSLSYYGDAEVEPVCDTFCFDLQEGEVCDTMYFAAAPDTEEDIAEYIGDYLYRNPPADFYDGIMGLTASQHEALKTVVDIENFYITENGIGFYFDKFLIDANESGVYRFEIPWHEITQFFIAPQDLIS